VLTTVTTLAELNSLANTHDSGSYIENPHVRANVRKCALQVLKSRHYLQ